MTNQNQEFTLPGLVELCLFSSTVSFLNPSSKGKLLKKAASMLVAEKEQNKRDRESALNERVPPLKLSGLSGQELQVDSESHCCE